MPADFIFKLFMLLCVLGMELSWLFSLAMLGDRSSPEYSKWEVEAQRRSIQRRLRDPLYYVQRVAPSDGEMSVYISCYYGYSIVNIALLYKRDEAFKKEARRELLELLILAEAASKKAPLNTESYSKLRPAGGIIPAGNTNLLRAGYLMIGGKDPEVAAAFHENSKLLLDAFTNSPVPFLESAPKMYWPIDNCAGLESLRLHDKLFGTSYSKACNRAKEFLQTHVDPENGMMNIQVDKSGLRLDVPRGCGLSWQIALMQGFAPALNKSQYQLYKQNWFMPLCGMYAIREWWPGQEKMSLIPAGPVVAGAGWAATGLGIGAAHISNDLDGFIGLLRGLELLGFPCLNLRGEKYYCGGLFLVADIMALWVKTNCVWDRPDLDYREIWQAKAFKNLLPDWPYYLVIAGAALISFLLVFLLANDLMSSWRKLRQLPVSQWTRANKIMFCVQSSLACLVLYEPVFLWPLLVLMMLVLKFVEQKK